jgi:hypothetical protein
MEFRPAILWVALGITVAVGLGLVLWGFGGNPGRYNGPEKTTAKGNE